MRLLLVSTPPEDDPCQHGSDGNRCGMRHGGSLSHPFVGPREVTTEDLARAMLACGWCGTSASTTQHAPGHDEEPESDGRHRFRAIHAERFLAALLEPPG